MTDQPSSGITLKPCPKYTADFQIIVTVEFTDDGGNDVTDQAFDALHDAPWSTASSLLQDADICIVGKPQKVSA